MKSLHIYKRFLEEVKPEFYESQAIMITGHLQKIIPRLIHLMENNYEFKVLEERKKKQIIELIENYIKNILTKYPSGENIKELNSMAKKLFRAGISDVSIIELFSTIKTELRTMDFPSYLIEKKLDADLLVLLKPFTYVSLEIDKKIENIVNITNLHDSIDLIDHINIAKKEHLKVKNRVIKDIFEDSKNINIKPANRCEFYKTLQGLEAGILKKNEILSQIDQVHIKFHEYIDFYKKNKDKLTTQQKYLLIKELESISLKILYMLNQLQIEISSQLSFFDFLTESYNKNIFPVIFQKEIKRAERYGLPLTVSIIDIDNFKKINDTYGHLTGDEVLRELSKLIKGNIRQSDYLFRFGGEEFILLLPHTDIEGALMTTEKIRKNVEKTVFTEKQIHLTISCGISEVKHLDNPYLDLEEADKMLYVSKSSGKNRCTVARRDI